MKDREKHTRAILANCLDPDELSDADVELLYICMAGLQWSADTKHIVTSALDRVRHVLESVQIFGEECEG